MDVYMAAWAVVLASTPLALFALHRATRGTRAAAVRRLLLPVAAVCLVVPTPVPGYPGQMAPAWLVLVLEWGFQAQGQPAAAAAALSGGAALGLAIGVVWWLLGRRGSAPGKAPAGRKEV
jgi:hypothetical protein